MSTYNVAFNSTLVSESPKGILVEMLWHVRSYYISNRQHGMRTLRLHSQHSTILISTCMLLHMHWYSLHTNIHYLNLHKIVILKKKLLYSTMKHFLQNQLQKNKNCAYIIFKYIF